MAETVTKGCIITINGLDVPFTNDKDLDAYLYEHRVSLSKQFTNGEIDSTFSMPSDQQETYDKLKSVSLEGRRKWGRGSIRSDRDKRWIGASQMYHFGGKVGLVTEPLISYNSVKVQEIKDEGFSEDVAKDIAEEIEDPISVSKKTFGTDFHRCLELAVAGKSFGEINLNEFSAFNRMVKSDPATQIKTIESLYKQAQDAISEIKSKYPGCKLLTETDFYATHLHPDMKNHLQVATGRNQLETVVGIADLIIVTKDNKIVLVDWKTSNKPIGSNVLKASPDGNTWSRTKRIDVISQLSAERAILEQNGFDVHEVLVGNFVIDFNKDGSFKEMKREGLSKVHDVVYLNHARTHIPVKLNTTLGSLSEIDDSITQIIPSLNSTSKKADKESRVKYYFDKSYVKEIKQGNKTIWTFHKAKITGGQEVKKTSKEDMENYLRDYFDELDDAYANLYTNVAMEIQKYTVDGGNVEGFKEWIESSGVHNSINGFFHLKKYVALGWTLDHTPELIANGIFIFTNNGRSEIVMLTNDEAHRKLQIQNGRGTSILGLKLADNESGTDSQYIFPAEVGRLLEMKLMCLISKNQDRFKNNPISQIKIMSLSNEEVVSDELWRLQFNWEQLTRVFREAGLVTIDPDCFMDEAEAALALAEDAVRSEGWTLYAKNDDLEEQGFNAELMLKMIRRIQSHYGIRDFTSSSHSTSTGNFALYQLLRAYNYFVGKKEFNGISEADRGLYVSGQHPGVVSKAIPDGLEMTSPDTSDSANFRIVGRIIDAWKTSIETQLHKISFQWMQHIKAIQEAGGYSSLEGGEYKWFENWFEKDDSGEVSIDFKLKDPETDHYFQAPNKSAEKEACRFFLKMINQYRKTKTRDEQLRVPLVRAQGFEQFANLGLRDFAKEKWKSIIDPLRDDFNDDSTEIRRGRTVRDEASNPSQLTELFNPYSDIDAGTRSRMLESNGTNHYSKNLDIVFLRVMEWNLKCETGQHFMPIISLMRTFLMVENDINAAGMVKIQKTIEDYIKANIFNIDLVETTLRPLIGLINAISGEISKITLGGKVRSLLTETVTGWVNTAKSAWASDNGSFDTVMAGFDLNVYAEAMVEAFNLAMQAGGLESKSQQLNAIYGMFGFGFGQMSESQKANRYGIKNLDSEVLYWTSSAGDYLNRNALLVMKLKKIGAYDAYVKDENGMYVYDMSLDKRWDVYMKYGEDDTLIPPGNIEELREYRKQQQAYHESIDAWKALGGDFANLKYGDKLPHALDPDEQKTLRTQSDILYGNFDKQTRMLLSKRALGRMFMQFKTYGYAKLLTYIKTPGAVNVFPKHIVEEINPKTGKLEKKVKVICSEERRKETGNFFEEFFESEVPEEAWRNNTASYVRVATGSPFEGKFQTMLAVLSIINKSPQDWAAEWERIRTNPAQKYNLWAGLFETLFMSIFATLIGKLYGEETISNLTDEDWWTRWSYNVLNGIATDGPIWYTLESIASDGTVPMFSILKRYSDNTIALFEGRQNVLYTLVNTFGATQELSSYFNDL